MPAPMILEPDVEQGYNFNKTVGKPCGFVTQLKIGDKDIAADQEINNILEAGKKKVVGVLSFVDWGTGVTDPVLLEMRVSPKTKQDLSQLRFGEMTKNNVTYIVEVFNFDSVKQQFFQEFHTQDTPMEGTVQKVQGDFVFEIRANVATEVKSPENYFFKLGVDPKTQDQTFHIGVSAEGKLTKQWGMNIT